MTTTSPPAVLARTLANLIVQNAPPAARSVEILPNATIKVVCGDRSELYAKPCHQTPAGKPTPEAPAWESTAATPAGPHTVHDNPEIPSMTAGYMAGLCRHLLTGADGVTGVRSLSDAGADGPAWARFGLAATIGGSTVYVAALRASGPAGDPANMPTDYTPEDHDVPALRS